MELKPGTRIKSSVCSTEIIIVKSPGEADLTCGGAAMDEDAAAGEISADASEGTLMGKRYVNEDGSLEVLCTKAGEGSLGVGGALMEEKEAKALPASD